MDKEAVGMERGAFEREFNAFDWRHKSTGEICAHFWQAGRAELRANLAQQPAAQAAGLTDEQRKQAFDTWLEIERKRRAFGVNIEEQRGFCSGFAAACALYDRALLSRAAPSGKIIGWVRNDMGWSMPEFTNNPDHVALNPQAWDAVTYAGPQPSGKPVAWVRFRSDGGIEGPILDTDPRMDDVRRKSGAWTALGVITPQPSEQQAETMIHYGGGLAGNVSFEHPAEEARGVDESAAFDAAFVKETGIALCADGTFSSDQDRHSYEIAKWAWQARAALAASKEGA